MVLSVKNKLLFSMVLSVFSCMIVVSEANNIMTQDTQNSKIKDTTLEDAKRRFLLLEEMCCKIKSCTSTKELEKVLDNYFENMKPCGNSALDSSWFQNEMSGNWNNLSDLMCKKMKDQNKNRNRALTEATIEMFDSVRDKLAQEITAKDPSFIANVRSSSVTKWMKNYPWYSVAVVAAVTIAIVEVVHAYVKTEKIDC